DYREGNSGAPQDQTTVLFAMNDNYGNPGDTCFDDDVAQSDAGMPSTCYPIQNSRHQGLVVGFPPGSWLTQLADSPGKDRACPRILVRLATQNQADAIASQSDPNPMNRKVWVSSQTLAPNGGGVEFKIPSGGYVMYGYQWPEAARTTKKELHRLSPRRGEWRCRFQPDLPVQDARQRGRIRHRHRRRERLQQNLRH
ncbi:MAG: hypothetical protein NTZ16_14690, partial [Verrucomicrobia bacterium]|nr:hypothetical protein [Verrucomicrobiota bacterium]